MEKFCIRFSFLLFLLLFTSNCFASTQNDDVDEGSLSGPEPVQIRVGLILDLGSLEGKIVGSSVSMALSDFYAINNDYKTQISISLRNSRGEPLLALSSAVDLLKNEGVETIIVGNSLLEAKLLAEIGEKAKVPVISLNSPNSLSLSKYSHLIQATHDSASEAKGITAFINGFEWNSVALVYEDDDDWRESMQVLVDHFHENSVRVQSKVGFEVSSSEDFMMDRLQKLKELGTTVFVVHLSEFIATQLFQCAERLGLMGEGFAWILTAKTMNSFHVKADDFAKEAMEGVIGFRTYIPMSKKLQNFTLRWRKSLADAEVLDGSEITRLSISGVWAHDIAWALASAVEVSKVTKVTSTLLEAITESRFKGLSGEFQFNDRKLLSDKFEIVNLVGSGERRVGFWNSNGTFSNRRHLASTHNRLETIIWPGGSSQIPKASNLDEMSKKKLRVLVTSNNRFQRLMKVEFDPQTNIVTSVTGFCKEVFEAAIAPFNYEVVYIRWLNEDDSNYNDLAYALYSQKDQYDAAVGDITITSNRSTFVDFTLPFTEMGLGIVAAKERSMWVFFQPLTVNLWITTAAFFVLTGIVVWLVERPENKKFQGPWPQQIGVMLYFGFSTLVYAHREKLQYNLSRFVLTVWVFAVLILTASYTATLTSMMTIQQIRFNANEDFVGVGQLPGSIIAKVALNTSGYQKSQIKGLSTSTDYAEALLNKSVSFIVDELPYLKVLLGENPEKFLMVKSQCTTDGFGFMFQKGHELVAKVSGEISKLRSNEKLNEMERRLVDKPSPLISDERSDPLSLYRFRGLFMITGVSFSIALAIKLILYLIEQSEVLVSSVKMFLSQRLQLLRIHFSRTIYPSPLDDPIGGNVVQIAQDVRS